MARLVKSLIARLKDGDPALKGDLWMVSDLLRKAWSESFHSGVEEIDSEDISQDGAVELREAVFEAFHRSPNGSTSRSLLYVLADAREESIKDELLKELHLALEIHRVASARLWAALRSLDNVGAKVFEQSESSRGIDGVALNIRVAERYLRDHGILVPL